MLYIVFTAWDHIVKPKELSKAEFIKSVEVLELNKNVNFDIRKLDETIFENGKVTHKYEIRHKQMEKPLVYKTTEELIWVNKNAKVRGELIMYGIPSAAGDTISEKIESSFASYTYVHIESIKLENQNPYQTLCEWKTQAFPLAYKQYKENPVELWTTMQFFGSFVYWGIAIAGAVLAVEGLFFGEY